MSSRLQFVTNRFNVIRHYSLDVHMCFHIVYLRGSGAKKFVGKVQLLMVFTYLGNDVCLTGGCEAVVTTVERCGWVKLRECCEVLCWKMFPLQVKGDV